MNSMTELLNAAAAALAARDGDRIQRLAAIAAAREARKAAQPNLI